MSVTAYPTLRLKLTVPQALKLQFLPAIPGSNAAASADAAQAAADAATAAANTAVAATANKVDKTGDVMTGFLQLNADPIANLQAATKHYVDTHTGGGGGITDAPSDSKIYGRLNAAWADLALSYQPLDGDLTALAALAGTNTIYYRSAANTWSAVNISTGLSFTGGNLTATGSGAPVGAEYITSTADATLTSERVLTDTASITWDRTTPGQIKASTAAGGGNVSNSGTPTAGQYGKWVTATTIQGVTPATVLSDIGAAPVASPTFTGDPKAPTATAGDNDTSIATTAFVTAAIAALPAGSSTVSEPQGRLTLQTATPVMTTTQSAKTTLFYSPYNGNQIPLYNGTSMVPTTFTELSNITTASSAGNAGPAAVAANSVYDLFVWSNAGTPTLTRGPVWTSDTARSAGTALVMVNGILLNAVAITNGPAIQRGTYVGTTRSNASSQLNWQLPGAQAGGFPGILGVWNAYNRVLSGGVCTETTASWITASTTPAPKNGSNGNSFAFVSGLQEDLAEAFNTQGLVSNASDGTTVLCGIGVDTTTTFTSIGGQGGGGVSVNAGTPACQHTASSLGYHTWTALNATNAVINTTTFGTLAGPPARNYSAMSFWFPM